MTPTSCAGSAVCSRQAGARTVDGIPEEVDEHGDHAEVGLQRARGREQRVVVLRVDAVVEVDVRWVGGGGVDGRGRAVAMAVPAVVVHDEHAHDVQGEPDAADDHDLLWAVDGLDVDEPLEGLEEDGERQGEEEYTIEEGALEG